MKEYIIDEDYKIVFNEETKLWDYYKNEKIVPKSAEKLFKYYSLSINNIDALLNNYYYLSNPGDFNDPFDCNINLVSNHENGLLDNVKIVKRNMIENLGVVSFSETIDNHLMWAHYTNNYNGFALEFKGTKIQTYFKENQVAKKTLTKVIYPKTLKQIEKEFKFAQHYVFTTKLKHWEYEQEWRILCELLEPFDRILSYAPDTVEALYVGHRLIDTNESAYRILLEIHEIRFPTIPIFVVYPHPTELKLEFERVIN